LFQDGLAGLDFRQQLGAGLAPGLGQKHVDESVDDLGKAMSKPSRALGPESSGSAEARRGGFRTVSHNDESGLLEPGVVSGYRSFNRMRPWMRAAATSHGLMPKKA
jgi:hypothetical protein